MQRPRDDEVAKWTEIRQAFSELNDVWNWFSRGIDAKLTARGSKSAFRPWKDTDGNLVYKLPESGWLIILGDIGTGMIGSTV